MPEVIAAVIGIIVGGVVVGLVMHFRSKTLVQEKAAELESRASGAEGTVIELRNQVNAVSAELQSVRERLAGEAEARVAARTELDAARRSIEEQRKTLQDAEKNLTDAFQALAANALKGNREEFAALAKDKIGEVVSPLKDTLARYEEQLRDMEKARAGAYSGLTTRLGDLAQTNLSLGQQTAKLEQALRAPVVRGVWGEMMLDKVLELAQLGPPIAVPQPTVDSEEGQLRPDLIVNLPDKRTIIVDSKVPLTSYLDAMATDSPELRKRKIGEHASAVRSHMRKLSQKNYPKQFETSTEMVIMFLPGESFLAAAVDSDPSLIEDSIRSRVILATPTTLVLALLTVAHTWRQQKLAENAREIADAGKDLYERLCKFMVYLANIGKAIDNASKSYNEAVGSWDSRLRPGAETLKELGAAAAGKELPEIPTVDTALRALPPGEEKQEEPPKE